MNLRSILLLIGAANGLLLAALVLRARRNRLANRLLALLIGLVTLRVAPYILGFAGAYDRWPWLTFAPFDLSLAFGPVLWAYVSALAQGRLPRRFSLHLLPAALQVGYQVIAFALPINAKWAWYSGAHLRVVEPLGLAVVLASLAGYVALSWLRYRRHRAWLDEHYAPRDAWTLTWLRDLLIAFGLATAVAIGYAVVAWFTTPLDYFQRFPLMLGLCGLVYVLGLLGWRHADEEFPQAAAVIQPVAVVDSVADFDDGSAGARVVSSRYREQAERWRTRVAEAGWWRDETLNLAGLAERLHSSERSLSRVLKLGLDENFNAFINRLRLDAVLAELDDPGHRGDLIDIALAAGFSSKASFNRQFKARTGTTPSAYRADARRRLEIRQSATLATSATTSPPP